MPSEMRLSTVEGLKQLASIREAEIVQRTLEAAPGRRQSNARWIWTNGERRNVDFVGKVDGPVGSRPLVRLLEEKLLKIAWFSLFQKKCSEACTVEAFVALVRAAT